MKRSLLALAVLGAFTGVASAQSSVTLSGSVDAGVRRTTVVNAAKTGTEGAWGIGGSQSGYNAITFSGVEDLGGGSRAFFTLNHRFALGTGTINGTTNNGDNSVFFRNAWVGLGGRAGDVRVGRMLVPLQEFNGNFDPFATGTVGSTHTGGIAATIRANNTVYYRSPSMGGLSVHASMSAADNQNQNGSANPANGLAEIGAPNTVQGYFAPTAKLGKQRPAGIAARFNSGPVDFAVGYDRNTAEMKTIGVYGAYNFGAFKLMAQFEKGDNCTSAGTVAAPNVCTTSANGQEDIKAFSIGATAPIGPVLLRAGYLRINSSLDKRNASKFGLGGDYILSKRSNLYGTIGKWAGDRFDATGGSKIAGDATRKVMFDFGVTHKF